MARRWFYDGETSPVTVPAASVAATTGFMSSVAVTFAKAFIYQSVAVCPFTPAAAAETVTLDKYNAPVTTPTLRQSRAHFNSHTPFELRPITPQGWDLVDPVRPTLRKQQAPPAPWVIDTLPRPPSVSQWALDPARPKLPDKITRVDTAFAFTAMAVAETVTLDKWNADPARPYRVPIRPYLESILLEFETPIPPVVEETRGGHFIPIYEFRYKEKAKKAKGLKKKKLQKQPEKIVRVSPYETRRLAELIVGKPESVAKSEPIDAAVVAEKLRQIVLERVFAEQLTPVLNQLRVESEFVLSLARIANELVEKALAEQQEIEDLLIMMVIEDII